MGPRQFDFRAEWSTGVRTVRDVPAVAEGMAYVRRRWIELAEFKRGEMAVYDPDQAQAEYDLDLATFEVKQWDLNWQKTWTYGDSNILTDLSLGIARTLYPEREWEIIENGEFEVVTDRERTLVFDIHNFERLSAGASLHMAADDQYTPNGLDLHCARLYTEQEDAKSRKIIETMQTHLEAAKVDYFDNVTPIR